MRPATIVLACAFLPIVGACSSGGAPAGGPGSDDAGYDGGVPSGPFTLSTPRPGDVVGHTAGLAGTCPPGSIVHVAHPTEATLDVPCTGGGWSATVRVDASALGPLDITVTDAAGVPPTATVQLVHAPTTFTIAPAGDDALTGAPDHPIASLGRGRDLAAQASGLTQKPILVLLHAGQYALLDPVVFGPQHSGRPGAPITFQAFPNETPILHGAVAFSDGQGGHFADATLSSVSGPIGVKRFTFAEPLRSQLLARIAAIRGASNAGAFAITQAFLDGARLVRSRHPNTDTDVDARYVRLSTDCPTDGVDAASRQPYLMLPATDVGPVSASIGDGSTELVFTNVWQEHRAIVGGWNTATASMLGVSTNLGLAEVFSGCWTGYEGEKGHLENNAVFVDEAHEWFLDEKAATFDFVPEANDDTATATLYLPVNDRLVELAGTDAAHPVHDLVFRGLAVQFAAWRYANSLGTTAYNSFGQAEYGMGGSVDGNYVSSVVFDGLQFLHYGEYAVSLGGSREGAGRSGDGMASNITVQNCRFADGGAGSIRIDNRSSKAPTQATGNTITGNSIDTMGVVFRDAPGMLVMATSGTKLSNNTIHGVGYSGVSLGWGCAYTVADYNEISGNNVSSTMTFLRDGGGIYVTGSHGVATGNSVEIPGASRAPDAPAFVPDFSIGMYNDDYSTWWQDVNNTTHKVTTKSATNRRAGNVYGGNPAALVPPDGQPPLGTGAELNCPKRADGTSWQTPPTWWH
jgi:hypothetical protein